MIVIGGKEFTSLDQDIIINNKKVVEVYYGDKLVYPTEGYDYAYWFVLPHAMLVVGSLADVAGGYLKMANWVTPYKLAWNLTNASPNSSNVHCAMYVSFPGFGSVNGSIRYLPFAGYKGKIVQDADYPGSAMTSSLFAYEHTYNGKIYYVTPQIHLNFDTSGGSGGYVTNQNYTAIKSKKSKIFYDNAEAIIQYVCS